MQREGGAGVCARGNFLVVLPSDYRRSRNALALVRVHAAGNFDFEFLQDQRFGKGLLVRAQVHSYTVRRRVPTQCRPDLPRASGQVEREPSVHAGCPETLAPIGRERFNRGAVECLTSLVGYLTFQKGREAAQEHSHGDGVLGVDTKSGECVGKALFAGVDGVVSSLNRDCQDATVGSQQTGDLLRALFGDQIELYARQCRSVRHPCVQSNSAHSHVVPERTVLAGCGVARVIEGQDLPNVLSGFQQTSCVQFQARSPGHGPVHRIAGLAGFLLEKLEKVELVVVSVGYSAPGEGQGTVAEMRVRRRGDQRGILQSRRKLRCKAEESCLHD